MHRWMVCQKDAGRRCRVVVGRQQGFPEIVADAGIAQPRVADLPSLNHVAAHWLSASGVRFCLFQAYAQLQA